MSSLLTVLSALLSEIPSPSALSSSALSQRGRGYYEERECVAKNVHSFQRWLGLRNEATNVGVKKDSIRLRLKKGNSESEIETQIFEARNYD